MEALSWEPLRLVSHPCHTFTPASNGAHEESHLASLQLSNLDLLHDFFDSVVLFYDVTQSLAPLVLDDPVRRLYAAVGELLVYYPSAAGVLTHNGDGRLEVRYPLPPCDPATCSASAHKAGNLMAITPSAATRSCRNSGQASQISSGYGVRFHVAHADVAFADLGDVSYPQSSLNLLFPSAPTQGYSSNGEPLPRFILSFQITTFKCGSFALGQTCSHIYADGFSAATLLQNLCSLARGEGLANPPNFSLSRRDVFKPREPPSPTYRYTFMGVRECSTPLQEPAPSKLASYGTTTRFAFSLDALETLRAQASSQSKACSRVQALMALLWTAYARVKHEVHGFPTSHEMPLRFSINLRTRGIPNVTPRYVGNALFLCSVPATLEDLCEKPLPNVVDKIKETVASLDLAETLQSVIDDIEIKLGDGLVPSISGGGIGMASLVGLPFYNTDCGWNQPCSVGLPSQQMSHRCLILEHPAAREWNVMAAFASVEERKCFEEGLGTFSQSSR